LRYIGVTQLNRRLAGAQWRHPGRPQRPLRGFLDADDLGSSPGATCTSVRPEVVSYCVEVHGRRRQNPWASGNDCPNSRTSAAGTFFCATGGQWLVPTC
jgi:hypothetical protein